jgi:ABC-type dipeptide/oligopeptide/nickel transport system ATPase component
MTNKEVTITIQGRPGSGKSVVFASLLDWIRESNQLGAEVNIDLDESVKVSMVFLDQVEIEVTLTTE